MLGFKICKITGTSMAPRIPPNSYVLVVNWLNFLPVKTGQTLLLLHARYGHIIKNVAAVDNNGLIWSKGENATSMSVEKIGPVNKQKILGRVMMIFKA